MKKPVTVTMSAVRQLVRESLGIDMTTSVPIKPEEIVDPISVSTAPMQPNHPIQNIEELSWAIRDALTNVPIESAEQVYKEVLKTIERALGDEKMPANVIEQFIASGIVKKLLGESLEKRR